MTGDYIKPQSMPIGVCRHGDCMKIGAGRPPYCERHMPHHQMTTTIPWEPSPAALRAGNGRVAKTRRLP